MTAVTALRKLVGGILLAAGVLMATGCGLCTGYFGFVALTERGGDSFAPFLAVGVLATAIGVGLVFGGRALLRDR